MNYSQAIAAMTGLTVTGVKKSLGYMPARINTTDMPLLFPMLPTGQNSVAALTGSKGLESIHVVLWVIVEPTQQNIAPTRFAECVAVMDGFIAAFANDPNVDEYALRMDIIPLEQATYWGVVAEIEVS